MDINQRLGRIRYILADSPSSEGFEQILAAFEGWTQDDGVKVGLEYAQRHFERWPLSLLRPSSALLTQVTQDPGDPPPVWGLVRWAALGTLDAAQLRRWLRSGALSKLRGLRVRVTDPDAMVALSSARSLKSLRALELVGAGVDAEATNRLARTRQLKGLEALSWRGNRLLGVRTGRAHVEHMEVLASNTALRALRYLDVSGCRVGPGGARALAEGALERLESLSISERFYGHQAENARIVDVLWAAENLPVLSRLDFGGRALPEGQGAKVLGRTSSGSLTHLNAQGVGVRDEDLCRAASEGRLGSFRWLNLAEGGQFLGPQRIGDAGLSAFVSAGGLKGLETLFVHGNGAERNYGSYGFGPAGVEALVGSPDASSLRVLDLSDNPIGDAGAHLLAQSEHLSSLECLNIRTTGMSEVGLGALASSPHLPALKCLYVSPWLNERWRRELRERFGALELFKTLSAHLVGHSIPWDEF